MTNIRADITSSEADELREFGVMRRPVDVADLRIILRHRVDSEHLPGDANRAISAPAGTPTPVKLNNYGAVCAVLPGGALLGIKPREFDFVCPFAAGRTYLDEFWRIDVAPGQMLGCPDGDRWIVASVKLVRAEMAGWGWVVDAELVP
jgi:hypothetical protein